jgi:hypothetical protein
LFTTKRTKDTKVANIQLLNFVRFVLLWLKVFAALTHSSLSLWERARVRALTSILSQRERR